MEYCPTRPNYGKISRSRLRRLPSAHRARYPNPPLFLIFPHGPVQHTENLTLLPLGKMPGKTKANDEVEAAGRAVVAVGRAQVERLSEPAAAKCKALIC